MGGMGHGGQQWRKEKQSLAHVLKVDLGGPCSLMS